MPATAGLTVVRSELSVCRTRKVFKTSLGLSFLLAVEEGLGLILTIAVDEVTASDEVVI
jgi:hypothetical protein